MLREKKTPGYPVVAEAQTLLYASRDIDPASVRIFSIKNAVPVAALPAYLTPDVLAVTNKCLPFFVAGDNVLKTGLDNIGAIFHPALTILNAAWIEERHGDFEYYLEGPARPWLQILEAMDQRAGGGGLGAGHRGAHRARMAVLGLRGHGKEPPRGNPGESGLHRHQGS